MKQSLKNTFLSILISLIGLTCIESCISFYCINSCGSSNTNTARKGFKLISAINRDENIYRKTLPASVWPSKNTKIPNNKNLNCDQSKLNPPHNLCVYGALDVERGYPPDYYSTWLGNFQFSLYQQQYIRTI